MDDVEALRVALIPCINHLLRLADNFCISNNRQYAEKAISDLYQAYDRLENQSKA
jgi:hypothetical protein